MAMDGYIVRVDFEELKGLMKLMASISSNINQISHRVNETGVGNIYAVDMEDLKCGCAEARWDIGTGKKAEGDMICHGGGHGEFWGIKR